MKPNPIKYGLYGGISFALVQIVLSYVINKEFNYVGLLGGLMWFLTSIWFFGDKKKRKL